MTTTADINKIPHSKKQAFLRAYVECGNISHSAIAAKIDRTTHYCWLDHDTDYAAAFELAERMYKSALVDEARNRAVNGLRQYKFYGGQPIYVECSPDHPEAKIIHDEESGETRYVRHYYEDVRSDVLLAQQLNAAFPDEYGRYRHDHEHSGHIEHDVNLDKEIEAEIMRLRENVALQSQAESAATTPAATSNGKSNGRHE